VERTSLLHCVTITAKQFYSRELKR